ncbi:hypothetical protein GQ42DRAFT_169173 [Ramicandelaber brevisporus]|nr:hypothetical protein GQ42DRAFT_169173 [Ramicandelaber brevisporus]
MPPASRTTTTTTTATTAATTTAAATATVRSSRLTRQTAAASAAQLNATSTAVDSEHSNEDTNVVITAVGKRRYKPRGKSKFGKHPGRKPAHIPFCPKHCRRCNMGFVSSSKMTRHLNCETHKKASEVDRNKVDEARFDKQAGCFDKNIFQLKEDYMNQSASPDDTNSYSIGGEDCPNCLELRDCTISDCSNHPQVSATSASASASASPSPKRHHTSEPTPVDIDTAGNASPFGDMDSSDIVIEPRSRNQPDYYENSEDELHLVYEEEEDYEMAESDDDDDGSSLTIDYGDGHSPNDTDETMDNSTVQPPTITSALLCDYAETSILNTYFASSNKQWSNLSEANGTTFGKVFSTYKVELETLLKNGVIDERANKILIIMIQKVYATVKRSSACAGTTMASRVKKLLPETEMMYAPKRNITKRSNVNNENSEQNENGNENESEKAINSSFGIVNAAWLIGKIVTAQPDMLDKAFCAPSSDAHSLHIVASPAVRFRESLQAICVQGPCFDAGVHITGFLFDAFVHMRYPVEDENANLPCVVSPYRILCDADNNSQLICFAVYFNSDNRIKEAAEVVVDLKNVVPYPVESYSGNGNYGYTYTTMQQLCNRLKTRLAAHFAHITAYNNQLQKHLDVVLPTAPPPPPYSSNLPASYCLDLEYVSKMRASINTLIQNQQQSQMASDIDREFSIDKGNVVIRTFPYNFWADGLGTIGGKGIDSIALSPAFLADEFDGERVIPLALNNREHLCGHHLVEILKELESGYCFKKDGVLYILFSPVCICPADSMAMSEVHEFAYLNSRNGCRLCMSTIHSTNYNKLPLSSLLVEPSVLRTVAFERKLDQIAAFIRQLPPIKMQQSLTQQRVNAISSSTSTIPASTQIPTASNANTNSKNSKNKTNKTNTATVTATANKAVAAPNAQQVGSGRQVQRFIERSLAEDDGYGSDVESEEIDSDMENDEDDEALNSASIDTLSGNAAEVTLETFGLDDMQGFKELLISCNLLKQTEADKMKKGITKRMIRILMERIEKAKNSKSGVYHELAEYLKSRVPLAAFPLDGLHLLALGIVKDIVTTVATADISINTEDKDKPSEYDPQSKLPAKRQQYIDYLIKHFRLFNAEHKRPILLTTQIKSATGGYILDFFIAFVEEILDKVEKHYQVPEFKMLERLLTIYRMLYQHKGNSTPLELAKVVNIELKELASELVKLEGWTNNDGKRIFEDAIRSTPKMHHFIQHSAPFLYLTGSFHYSSTQRYESTNKIARSVAVAMNHTGNTTFFASLRLFRVFLIKVHYQRLENDEEYKQATEEAAAAERKRYFMARAAKKRDTIARRSAAAPSDGGEDGGGDEEEVTGDASDAMDVD